MEAMIERGPETRPESGAIPAGFIAWIRESGGGNAFITAISRLSFLPSLRSRPESVHGFKIRLGFRKARKGSLLEKP
jgi:hypothetical protein